MKPIISLCLPTNGITEWVFPVLESIYSQKVDNSLFEVVVTNNGNNEDFHRRILEYKQGKNNLIYKKTEAFMFHNQLEALKLASGAYLKLINHRGIFLDGALETMILTIKKYLSEKPVIYFSNGALGRDFELHTFNNFVQELGIYASWTTGVGIWKSKYDELPLDIRVDKISPHSCILFSDRNNKKYIINDMIFSKDIDTSHKNKGKYDLFKAFAIEELAITQGLYIDGDITGSTLKKVKNDYKKFVKELYWTFCIRKKPCSYDLSGFDDAMGVYFDKYDIILGAYILGTKRLFNKLFGGNKK